MLKPTTVPEDPTTIVRWPFHTTLRVHCGCGESYDSVSDAERHATATGHTLHITGQIKVNRAS